jgi:hypothetical protein
MSSAGLPRGYRNDWPAGRSIQEKQSMASLAHQYEEGGWGMHLILFWQIIAIGVIVE